MLRWPRIFGEHPIYVQAKAISSSYGCLLVYLFATTKSRIPLRYKAPVISEQNFEWLSISRRNFN